MADGTRVACPHCHFEQRLPVTITGQMTFGNNGRNIVVHCPICERDFDAAPGDAVYEVVGGRFRLVRELRKATLLALQEASTVEELEQLIGALGRAARDDATTVADAVAPSGFFPQFEAWARQNPALSKVVGSLLLIILTALVTRAVTPEPKDPAPPIVKVEVHQPDDAELARLITEAIERYEEQADPTQAAARPGP